MDVGEEGDQHDDPGASAQLAGLTRPRKDARDVPRCPSHRLHVQRNGRKDLAEADKPVERPPLHLSAVRRPERCRASAKEYDDQVGDADGEGAAGCGQQQDALKSGHSAPPREARARLLSY